MPADRRILDRGNHRPQGLVQRGLAFRAVEIPACGFAAPQQVDHRHRGVQHGPHRPRPLRPDQVIGVKPLGQHGKSQPLPGLQQRQRKVNHPHCGALACGIAVQRDDRLGGYPPHQAQLILGNRGAKWGHDRAEPGFTQGDHVHIPLGHHQRLALARRFPRGSDVIQPPTLVEQFGFGGIEVFRLGRRVHRPAAQRDGATSGILDRKDDPAPETIKRRAATIGHRRQPRINHQPRINPLGRQMRKQPLPLIRRKPDIPAPLCRLGQAPLEQIGPRLCRSSGAQLQPEPLHRLLHHGHQLRAPVRPDLRLRVAFGQGHADLAGQNLDRFDETHILGLAHERYRVALGMAAKAIVKPLAVIHMK